MIEKPTNVLPQIAKMAAKNGLYVGLFSILLSISTYIIDPLMMAKWWLGIIFFLVSLFLVTYGAIDIRKRMGGYLNFREALSAVFIIFMVSAFVNQVYSYILFTYIDPQLTQVLREAIINQTTEMMENMGAPQEDIDKTVSELEAKEFGTTSIRGAFQGFLFGGIISFVISMIIAAIIKRNKPIFEHE